MSAPMFASRQSWVSPGRIVIAGWTIPLMVRWVGAFESMLSAGDRVGAVELEVLQRQDPVRDAAQALREQGRQAVHLDHAAHAAEDLALGVGVGV